MPGATNRNQQTDLPISMETQPSPDQRQLAIVTSHHSPDPLSSWAQRFLTHYFTCRPSKLHTTLARILDEYVETRGNKNAIIAPRGGAKTTWVSKTFPLYNICHGLEHYILLVGDTTEQAQQNLEAVKYELTDNEELAQAYPDACGKGSVWSQDQIVTRNDIKIQALGAGKSFRGRSFRQYRPGLIIIDDLDDDEAVMSEHQRNKMWSWFAKVLIPIGTATTNFLFVGTALHRDDTLHRLKKTANWQFQSFQGLISEPIRSDLWQQWRALYSNLDLSVKERQRLALEMFDRHREDMLAGSEVLWPDREPLYALMEYRASYGEAAFLSEYQGVPTADLAAEWPPECFAESVWFDRWPELKLKVIALDPSKGKTDSSDFSAYVLIGLSSDGMLYVDADLARRDSTRIVEDGFALASVFQPHLFTVEINQFQELLKTEFERQAELQGIVLPLAGVTNSLKKTTRIRTLGPYLRQGKFRFKRSSRGAELLVDQLREFPCSQHDDGPDALQMGIEGIKHMLGLGTKTEPDSECWNA
jgi:predicted phage terminase large subunit-like protein